MLNIARSQVMSGTGTVLDVFLTDPALRDAILRDPTALSFAIYSVSAAGARTQVFPATPGDKQTVSLTTHKLGTGHFYAAFTMPADAPLGAGEVHWWYTVNAVEREIIAPLEITASQTVYRSGYCLLSDVRAEGLAAAAASDARVLQAINLASRYIERVTKRWFEPRYCEFELDGDGTKVLLLPAPLIAIESITASLDGDFASVDEMEVTAYRAYARHVTTGMVHPDDDRNCPKIELVNDLELERLGFDLNRWPKGRRNILIKGVFGYTEYDGSPAGKTPDLLREICTSLVLARTPKMNSRSTTAGRIISEKTRDQSVTYSDRGTDGAFTGDPQIDSMLEAFIASPAFEVV